VSPAGANEWPPALIFAQPTTGTSCVLLVHRSLRCNARPPPPNHDASLQPLTNCCSLDYYVHIAILYKYILSRLTPDVKIYLQVQKEEENLAAVLMTHSRR
jgi:hypothetical protein